MRTATATTNGSNGNHKSSNLKPAVVVKHKDGCLCEDCRKDVQPPDTQQVTTPTTTDKDLEILQLREQLEKSRSEVRRLTLSFDEHERLKRQYNELGTKALTYREEIDLLTQENHQLTRKLRQKKSKKQK